MYQWSRMICKLRSIGKTMVRINLKTLTRNLPGALGTWLTETLLQPSSMGQGLLHLCSGGTQQCQLKRMTQLTELIYNC